MAKKYNLQAMMLSELLQGLVDADALPSCSVSGLALDSRDIRAGDVFIALQGDTGHGIEFAQAAVNNGAVAILRDANEAKAVESVVSFAAIKSQIPVIAVPGLVDNLARLTVRFYGNATKNLNMIGITGTNGKTTCSQYIAQALNHYRSTAVMGTLGNGFLGNLRVTRHTTPDNIALHRMLNEFYADGAMNVVMEVSSHGIEQGRVENLHFDLVMFTNLTRDHLDYHGSMAAYGEAKRKLFESYHASVAVINADDDFGRTLLAELPAHIRKISYSIAPAAHSEQNEEYVHATSIVQTNQGMFINIDSSWGKTELRTPLLGRFNASNLMGVLAVLLCMDFSLQSAVRQIAAFVAIPGRMQSIAAANRHPMVVVDYAHTPDALQNVLRAVAEHRDGEHADADQAGGRIWCVFGCGGDRDKGKRAAMGRIARELADEIVLTDDNPRTEAAQDIIADITAGFDAETKYTAIHDRKAAIRHAIEQAGPADIVLIAGKGHEQYQIIGKEKRPYPADLSIATGVINEINKRGSV